MNCRGNYIAVLGWLVRGGPGLRSAGGLKQAAFSLHVTLVTDPVHIGLEPDPIHLPVISKQNFFQIFTHAYMSVIELTNPVHYYLSIYLRLVSSATNLVISIRQHDGAEEEEGSGSATDYNVSGSGSQKLRIRTDPDLKHRIFFIKEIVFRKY
jgi:hypothetical protein